MPLSFTKSGKNRRHIKTTILDATRNIARFYERLTPAWSTAQRPRRGADEGYRSAEGGFFRYAPSEKKNVSIIINNPDAVCEITLRTNKKAPTYLSAAGALSA